MINNVFIWGSKSYALLGDGDYIKAGAVVTKNVRKNSIIVGNPGKHVKINICMTIKFYKKFKLIKND